MDEENGRSDERNVRKVPTNVILSGVAEVIGLGAIIAACFLISLIAGIIAAGVGLLILGQLIDPPNFRRGD